MTSYVIPALSKCWIHRFDGNKCSRKKIWQIAHHCCDLSSKQTTEQKSSACHRSCRSLPIWMAYETHECARDDDRDDDKLYFYSFLYASVRSAGNCARESTKKAHVTKINVWCGRSCACELSPLKAHAIPPSTQHQPNEQNETKTPIENKYLSWSV